MKKSISNSLRLGIRQSLSLAASVTIVAALLSAAAPESRAADFQLANPTFANLPAGGASKLAGWQIAAFHGTPEPVISFENDGEKSFSRLQFNNTNPNRELIFSAAQRIEANAKPDEDFQVRLKYRAQQKLPLYVAISAGQGCSLPYVRSALPTNAAAGEWQTATVNLAAFRFQDANAIWNKNLFLEIFTVGQPVSLPVHLDLAEVSLSIVPSAMGLRSVTDAERAAVVAVDEKLEQLPPLQGRAAAWASRITSERSQFDDVLKPGARLNDAERHKLNQFIAWAGTLADAIQSGTISQTEGFQAFELNPINNQQILPDTKFFSGTITKSISAVTARNASVPIGIVVSAEQDLRGLLLSVAPFRNASGQDEPRIGIDRKMVKAWYQDQNEYWKQTPPSFELPAPTPQATPVNTDPAAFSYSPMDRAGMRILTPELLVNDPDLVTTDSSTKSSSVRVRKGKETSLLRVDDPAGVNASSIETFNVTDAPKLLPVAITAGTNQQFWIDLDVPADVSPGTYRSELRFSENGRDVGSVPITLDVRPTVLGTSDFIESLYYHPVNYRNETGYTVFYPGNKAWEQTKTEFADLGRHDVTDVLFCGAFQNPPDGSPLDLADFKRRVELRKQAGLRTDRVFYTGLMLRAVRTAQQEEYVRSQVRNLMSAAKSAGVREVYVYSQDEASGEALAALRRAWEIAHAEGAKIFAAGSREDMFPLMGDKLDLFICNGYPDRREAKRWHDAGKKIACYSNPQGGLEQPDAYRRNYGILLWQHDYDGAAPYTYHTGGRQTGGNVPNVWNDYIQNPDAMKQLAMVYPTADGVIDTIQMKGLREAYADIRYLKALEKAVAEKQLPEPIVGQAKAWLAELKAGDINRDQQDPAELRVQILNFLASSKQDQP